MLCLSSAPVFSVIRQHVALTAISSPVNARSNLNLLLSAPVSHFGSLHPNFSAFPHSVCAQKDPSRAGGILATVDIACLQLHTPPHNRTRRRGDRHGESKQRRAIRVSRCSLGPGFQGGRILCFRAESAAQERNWRHGGGGETVVGPGLGQVPNHSLKDARALGTC